MKGSVPADHAAQRRLNARFLASLLIGVGFGLLLAAWRGGMPLLAVGAVLLIAAGVVWPTLMEASLQRFSDAGTRRCLHCGLRRRPDEGFCMECGTRAPSEEKEATQPKEAWEHEW